ncbi:MAG: cytochrome c family protein [Rickettsiaceae bacterium]|nr:cytochrome c family protein [Rickettsiaceae bacterium]
MSNLEWNKIAASFLLTALVIMLAGNIADILYRPNLPAEHRGFEVAVSDVAASQSGAQASAPEAPIDIKALMAKASAQAGSLLAKKCIACHSLDKGGPNKVGPHLWGVVQRAKASISDYKYSAALSGKGGVWDIEDLAAFLHKPSAYAPGTKMGFMGFAKPEDIANVIAYLETLKD